MTGFPCSVIPSERSEWRDLLGEFPEPINRSLDSLRSLGMTVSYRIST